MAILDRTISYAKVIEYECLQCQRRYVHKFGEKLCNNCGTNDNCDFIVVYQRNDDVVESMYTRRDLTGG